MKILVLSDSHAALGFMRLSIDAVKPDAVIHLGDFFDDGTAMAEENPHIRFYQVPGNCDRYRCAPWQAEISSCRIGGISTASSPVPHVCWRTPEKAARRSFCTAIPTVRNVCRKRMACG